MNRRFDPIFEACRQNRLDEKKLEQYISAMIKDEDIQSIAAAYKEEGLQEGFEKGMKKGMEKGMEKGKIDTARKLLGRGMTVEDVADIVELPLADVEKLK